ncbi:MAG: DUF4275 family protein [Sedimentibacter sp.]
MDLADKLRLRNVSIEVLDNVGKDLRKQWEEKFTGNLSNTQKNKIYLNQYLWHIFSYQQVEHLSGQEAVEAFNTIKKNECFAFYQHDNKALKLINSKNIKAEDFDNENDVYIVDNNMTWTYVHTHEYNCGPYFYKIKK